MRVSKKDGQVLIGRVVSADENELSLIVVGNQIVKIQRTEIAKTENEVNSLMYEGLISGLSDSQKDALLNYIISLSN